MKTLEFSLRLEVPSEVDFFAEATQDALFEAGLDDVGFGSVGREVYADFEREGTTSPKQSGRQSIKWRLPFRV